ncbi:hypothetical protein BDE36_0562 [Arcticibacter tournemirensis]|nr:hypothetical protein BDE36_0562 [Arcticibacter tournemirensis]
MNKLLCLFVIFCWKYTLAQNTDSVIWKENKIADSFSAIPIYDSGPKQCNSCICNLKNLFRSWKKDNIINYDEIELTGYRLVDSLTDSLKIRQYYERIVDTSSSYFIQYSGNTKMLKLLKADTLSKEYEEALQYMRNQLALSLTLNSTVYVIDMRLKDGTKIENYAVCDKAKRKITYDNMFFYFYLFR